MTEPFLIRALMAGLGLAFIAAPLGCFVVWRRMAYFGETVAQAGLMGSHCQNQSLCASLTCQRMVASRFCICQTRPVNGRSAIQPMMISVSVATDLAMVRPIANIMRALLTSPHKSAACAVPKF